MKAYYEIKKFASIIKRVHPHIIFIWLGYGIFHALTPFISLYFSAAILNQLIISDFKTAFYTVIIMCTGVMISSLMAKIFFNKVEMIRHTTRFGVDQELLKKAMVMEYEQLEMQETMDILRRTRLSCNGSGDLGSAVWFTARCGEQVFRILFALVIFLNFMIQIHTWDMYLIMLIMVLIVFMIMKHKFAKKQGILLKVLCDDNDHSNGVMQYLWKFFYQISSAKEVRLYHMDDFFIEKMAECMDDPTFMNYARKNGKLNFYNNLVSQGLSYAAYIYVASLAIRSLISIGQVLYVSGVILNAVNAIAEFQQSYAQLHHQLSYLNEFNDFLNLPNMHYEGTLPVEKRDDGEYEFEFRNVSFHYPERKELVLQNVNIKFNLKEKLAIVGMNGAGKTTIVKLLCRLYEPSSGEIFLNGIHIEKYDYREYVQLFSVVFQDFALFSYELDENIASGCSIKREKIHDAIARLDMIERVTSFPAQERSLLYKDNGDGVNLSGGEAQKIAIARALYKDAPFVILDEPTAALDPISEAEIYAHFDVLVEGKTTLYISHRMSSCKFCDRIIVMHKGQIEEEGTHETLLKNQHIYAELWNAQAKYYTN